MAARLSLSDIQNSTAKIAKITGIAPIRKVADIKKSTARIASITEVKPIQKDLAAKTAGRRKGRSGLMPQEILWHAVQPRWPGRAVAEKTNVVPDRNFRADICFEKERLIIEVDGFQYHAKHLEDFIKDRDRQNLLCIHGWRVLRFTPRKIHQELEQQLDMIKLALSIQPLFVKELAGAE